MPLAPVSTQAIDLADSSIFLNASVELRSGFGAPFLMATAMPERGQRRARRELALLDQVVDRRRR